MQALTLVELIVCIAMLAILFTSGFVIFRLAINVVEQSKNQTLAELAAADLIELAVSKRNENWNSLLPGQYYFADDPIEGIVFVAGQQQDGIYTKWIDVIEVERDANGVIVQSGGTVDPDTMKIVANVTWSIEGRGYDLSLTQYLTNWRRF